MKVDHAILFFSTKDKGLLYDLGRKTVTSSLKSSISGAKFEEEFIPKEKKNNISSYSAKS